MKVRLLSLNVDKNMPFARFQARVISSIKAYSDNSPSFEHFENMRDLFSALQEALENDELIITAVDNKHYTKLKLALIQALETEVQYNPSILNMLESDEEMNDNLRKDFSAFPEPATVFLSKDGLYSGFGIENGSQYFALLPIDNERINLILRNGLVPFLSKHLGSPEESEFLGENKHFDNEKVAISVKRLLDTGSVAAVNGTQNAEILKSCGDSVENFDDVFIFTPHVEDKGDVNATEYAAQLAKVSLDLSAANIGASISDIYTVGDSKYICIAVANDESAVVRKLYMSEDETEDAFIESAAVELFELVGEKAMGVQSVGIEITDGVVKAESEPEKTAKSKKTVAVTCGVLGVIIVLCAVLGIVYKMQGEDGAVAQKIKGIFGTNSTTQASPSTTEPQTTESTTEPEPVQKPLMKLSEFMANEIISLEKLKSLEENTSEESSSNAENEENTSSTASETVEDKGAPEFITVNGEKIPAKEALARFVMTEMGEGYNTEAIKAQTVVIYTYLKYRDTNFVIDGVEISETYNNEVMEAVEAVYGEYLSYNGEVALTPYFGIAARKTSNAQTVFSQSYSYLRDIEVTGNPDTKAENYKITKEYTLGEMKGILLAYNGNLTLSDEPAGWISVESHDAAVSSSIGYVTKVNVGGVEMSGLDFKTKVFSSQPLASHCFTVTYDSTSSTFTVTTYGEGLGVGMSKAGANSLAANGTKYKKILSTYFNTTTLTKEENV